MSDRSHWSSDRRLRLLLGLAREQPAAGLEAELGSVLADPTLRSGVLDVARHHRLYGLTVSRLVDVMRRAGYSREILDELGNELNALKRVAAIFDFERDRSIRALRSSGIRVIALKGAALRATLYRDPVERDVSDVDLLAPPEDADRAVEVLRAEGYAPYHTPEIVETYRRHHYHFHLRHQSGHVVEIHWAHTRPGWPFQLAPEEVREAAVEIGGPANENMWVPCRPHLVLLIVLQNLQERFSRLSRAVDIDRLVRAEGRFDWDALVSSAARGGLEAATAVSLQLCRRLLGTPVPARVMKDLRPSAAVRFHLAIVDPEQCLMRQSLFHGHADTRLFELWMVRGRAHRARQLLRQLGDAPLAEIAGGKGPGVGARLFGFGKLVVMQALLYVTALAGSVTARGRERLRFWSIPENGSRSERSA